MPQGKGTYGSQVGRPKKKYNKGGSVDPLNPFASRIKEAGKLARDSIRDKMASEDSDPFSTRNEEGVPAEQAMDMLEDANMANEGLPTSNAQERSQASPDVTEYKEGGFIKKAVEKIKDKSRIKKLEKSLKGGNTPKGHQKSERELAYLKQKGKEPTHKITGIAKPKKKGLKPAVVPSNPPLVPHYGEKGRSSLENLITDSVYGTGASKKRYGNKKGKKK